MIITALNDFKFVKKIILPCYLEKFSINPTMNQIYFTSPTRTDEDLITIDLGFKFCPTDSKVMSIRDYTLSNFFKANHKERQNMLANCQMLIEPIDPMHSINLLNVVAHLEEVDLLQDLVDKKCHYLIDSSDVSPADLLMNNNNFQGMSYLFKILEQYPENGFLDEKTLYHRLSTEPHWILEFDYFQKPQSIVGWSNVIFG